MAEAKVGLLYKLAAAVSHPKNKEVIKLKSYYLMQCKELTGGYGLPKKYFSSEIICPVCCLEWSNKTEIKIKPAILSKRQRKRLKSRKVTQNSKDLARHRRQLLASKHLEQICTFCKKARVTQIYKPIQKKNLDPEVKQKQPKSIASKKEIIKTNAKPKVDEAKKRNKTINVYSNALDVFSLQNKNNVIETKEKPVIKNNKKKKDKFAGLCQQAVLASAKLKEQKKDKLSLFLKPSK